MHASTVFLGLITGIMAAPFVEKRDPPTVFFAPYKFVGCRQSENPHSR
jgi:hypothetical protein